jgi:hypothetical protein
MGQEAASTARPCVATSKTSLAFSLIMYTDVTMKKQGCS